MNAYIWRHNRRFHSHSMIDEPVVHQDFYYDAVIVTVANTLEEALEIIKKNDDKWSIEDLKRLEVKIMPLDKANILFSDVRG